MQNLYYDDNKIIIIKYINIDILFQTKILTVSNTTHWLNVWPLGGTLYTCLPS